MKFLPIISLLFALTGNLHAAAENPADNSFAGKMGRVTGRLQAALASKDAVEFDGMHETLKKGLNFIARGSDPEIDRRDFGYKWSISPPDISVSDRNKDAIAAFFNTAAYVLIYLQRFTDEAKSPLAFYVDFINNSIPKIRGDTTAQITQTKQARYLLAHALTRFSGNDIEDGAAFKTRFRDGYLPGAEELLKRSIQGFTYPKPQLNCKSYLHDLGKAKARNISVTLYDTVKNLDKGALDKGAGDNFFRLMGLGHKPRITGFHSSSGFSRSTVNGVVVASSNFSEASITILLGGKQFEISGTQEAIDAITTAINPSARRMTAALSGIVLTLPGFPG